MSIRNLVFDLDGTLIDSSAGVIEAVNYALVRNGLPEEAPERILRYIGYPLAEMFRDFTDMPYEALRREFHEKARETVVQSTRALEGADQMLAELHGRGYRMGIATTKIRKHVEGIIDKFGWTGYFTATVGSDEVKRVKPEPDALLLILERLGAESHETVFVGDTENDVLAAKAVPMPVIGVTSPYGRVGELLLAGPDYFIESIGDLPGLVKRMSNGDGHR